MYLLKISKKSFENGWGGYFIIFSFFAILLPKLIKTFMINYMSISLPNILEAAINTGCYLLAINFMYFVFKTFKTKSEYEMSLEGKKGSILSFYSIGLLIVLIYIILINGTIPMMIGFKIIHIIFSIILFFFIIVAGRGLYYSINGIFTNRNCIIIFIKAMKDTIRSKISVQTIILGLLPLLIIIFISSEVRKLLLSSKLESLVSLYFAGIIEVILYSIGFISYIGAIFDKFGNEEIENEETKKKTHKVTEYICVVIGIILVFLLSLYFIRGCI